MRDVASLLKELDKIWLGSIFLKDEDGYKIILRSLEHYKKRLRSIGSSPELADAAMFSQIVQQEAMKNHPIVDELIKKIPTCLTNNNELNLLEKQVSMFLKALESYKSDILKVSSSPHEYYKKLIDISNIDENEISNIDTTIEKISSYSE